MKMMSLHVLGLGAALAASGVFVSPLSGQETPPVAAEKPPGDQATAGGSMEKALKYYEALVRRPSGGYVFDRFYNSWLDVQTIEELEKFLEDKANAPGATTGNRLTLAFFYAKQNEHVKTLEQFRLALEKDPGNADAWYQKALAESRTLDFDSALKDLAKALESNPSKELMREIRQLQGKLLARNGKTEDAMKVWKQLLTEHADDEDLQEDLIELQILEGLNQEALQTAEALLAMTKDPYKKIQRRLRIGDIQTRLGNRDKAVEIYSLCLSEVGSDSWLEKEILAQIEQTFRRDDALEDLKAHFAELVKQYPQRVTLRRAQARLLAESGETEAAIKVFQELLALTPGDREVRESYIALLAEGRKLEDAVGQLRELIKLHPTDGELLIKLAELYHEGMKKPEAQKTLEEFLEKSDKSESNYLRAAGLMDRFKLGEAALALYKTTAEKFPQSEAAQDNYVVALHKAGKKEEAIAGWRKLATGVDKTRLMNVARSAATRDEHLLAYELLAARVAEFGTDPLFLGQYCEEAQRAEKHAEALPHARKLLGMAQGPIELDSALTLISKIVQKAGMEEQLIKELKPTQDAREKCLLAELHEQGGSSKEAEALLQEVTAVEPELATSLLVRLQTTRGDFAAAAETLRKLVESPNGRKVVHVQRLIDLYERAGTLDKALAWIPEWKKLAPGSTLPWLKEADLQATLGKMKDALQSLRLAAQQFEGNEDVRAELAQAFRWGGKLADAERIYMQLFEEAKDTSAKVRWAGELAKTAELSGKTQELVDAFEERRRNNRGSVVPLLALAEIHRVTDNYEGRRKALLEAARLKRDDLELLLEIARIEESEGEFDRALETLKAAEPLEKNGDRVRNRRIKLLFAAGREKEARRMLLDLVSGAKMDPRAAESMAEGMVAQEMWTEAADFLAELVKLHPKDYRLGYLYAVVLRESDQSKLAREEFLRLLSLKEELPPAPGTQHTAVTPVISGRSWYDQLRDIFPPETVEALELIHNSHRALSYIQNRQNHLRYGRSTGYSHGYGGAGPQIAMPMSIEDVPRYVLPHLSLMTVDMDDAQKEALKDELRGFSKAYASLLDFMVDGQMRRGLEDIQEILDRMGDKADDSIMGMAAYSIINQRNKESALALRIFHHWRERRPLLAALTVAHLRDLDEAESQAARTFAVAEILKQEKPNFFLIQAIDEMLSSATDEGDPFAEDETAMPEGHTEGDAVKLRAKLLSWYAETDRTAPEAQQIFLLVLKDLVKQEDPKAMVEMMQEEVERHQQTVDSQKRAAQSRSHYVHGYFGYGFGGSNQMIVTFPPANPEEIPPVLLGLLSQEYRNYYGGQDWSPDLEKLKALLPTVKDPLLRTLLAYKAEDEATIEATLKELAARKEASLTNLMLASGWAAHKEKFSDAILTLKKAEYLPMTKDQRKTVDYTILAWASQQMETEDLPEDSPILSAAREAALRLRRDTLTPDQKLQLAQQMESLGLTEEAERLNNSLAAASSSGKYSSGTAYSGRVSNTPASKIESLIKKGKKSVAVQMQLKELRNLAKSWLKNPDDHMRDRAGAWLTQIQQNNLVLDLFKAVQEDAKSADGTVLAQAAAAAEILNKGKEAAALYQQALEKKPNDADIRFAYAIHVVRESPTQAADVLKDMDQKSLGMAVAMLSNQMHNLETNEQRIAIARLVLKYLENLKPDDVAKTDLSWFPSFLDSFAQYGYVRNGRSLPSLYVVAKPDDSTESSPEIIKEREEIAKAQAERREIHDKLCHAAIKFPPTARTSFTRLAGLALVEGKTVKDLTPMALEALRTELDKKPPMQHQYLIQTYYSSPQSEQIRFPSIEEVLLESALLDQNPKFIHDEIVPMLRERKATELAKTIAADAELYFKDGAEFATAVQLYVKRSATRNATGTMDRWKKVLQVMQLRNLDVDFADAILQSLKKVASQYHADVTPIVIYTRHLHTKKQLAEVADFHAKAAETFMGPKEKRAEFLRKHYTPENNSFNGPMALIRTWQRLFQHDYGDSPRLTFLMLEIYEREFTRFAGSHIGRENVIRVEPARFFQEARGGKDVAKIVTILKETPFFGDLRSFHPYPKEHEEQSIFGDLLEWLRRSGTEHMNKLRTEFAKTDSFGAKLCAACLEENPYPTLLTVLGTHLEELKQLAPENQRQFAHLLSWVRNQTGSNQDDAKLSDIAKAAKAWLNSLRGEESLRDVDRLLAVKDLASSGIAEFSMREFLERHFPGLVETDGAKALELLRKMRLLVADYRRTRSGSNYSFGDGSTAVGHGLGSALRTIRSNLDRTPNLDTAAHAINATSLALLETRGFPIELNDQISRELKSLLGKFGYEGEGDKQTFNVGKFLETAGTKLNPETQPILFGHLSWLLCESPTNAHKEENKAVREIIEQAAAGNQPYAWLALAAKHGVAMRANLAAQDDKISKANKAAEEAAKASGKPAEYPSLTRHQNIWELDKLPPEQKFLMGIVTNDKISLTARLAIVHHFIKDARESTEPLVRLQAARLLAEGWRAAKTTVVLSDDAGRIIRRLTALAEKTETASNEEIQKVSAELLAAWSKCTRQDHKSATASANLLELAINLKDSAIVNQIMRGAKDFVNRCWLAKLVQAGEFDAAQRLFNSGTPQLYDFQSSMRGVDVSHDDSWNYTDTLSQRIPEFLKMLEGTQNQYAAELALSSLPDTDSVKKAKLPDLNARLIDLAKRYPSAAMTDSTLAQQTLALLLQNSDAANALDPTALRKAAENLSFASIVSLDDYRAREQKSTVFKAHLRTRIHDKDFAFLRQTFEELFHLRTNNAYELGRMTTGLAWNCVNWTNEVHTSLDEAAKAENRAFWRDLAFNENAQQLFYSSYSSDTPAAGERVFHLVFLHALDDKMAELTVALEKLPETTKNKLRGAIVGIDAVAAMKRMDSIGWPKDTAKTLEAKSTVMLRMLPAFEPLGAHFGRDRGPLHMLSYWVSNKLIREEDILAKAEEIERIWPHQGVTAGEIGRLLAHKAGDDAAKQAQAAQWLERGRPNPQVVSGEKLIWRVIDVANSYTTMEMHKEAQQVLAIVTPEHLEKVTVESARNAYKTAKDNNDDQLILMEGGLEAQLGKMFAEMNKTAGSTAKWPEVLRVLQNAANATAKKKDFATEAKFHAAAAKLSQVMHGDQDNSGETGKWVTRYYSAKQKAKQDVMPKLVPRGAEWLYLSGGDTPAAGWTGAGFDTANWQKGKAPLGYNDESLETEITPGGTENSRPLTAYFRATFAVPDTATLKAPQLRLRRDDGAVIYLNGKEAARSNMPLEGEIRPDTPASKSLGGDDEAVYVEIPLNAALFQSGENILAIEVHQSNSASTDLIMDAELIPHAKSTAETLQDPAFKQDAREAFGTSWDAMPQELQLLIK